jgi:hypothetical protein
LTGATPACRGATFDNIREVVAVRHRHQERGIAGTLDHVCARREVRQKRRRIRADRETRRSTSDDLDRHVE